MMPCRWIAAAVLMLVGTAPSLAKQVPHGQDRVPGPPRDPAEALASMVVAEGFTVDLVAAEPDLVNPVAFCFDERGRAWITESLEYPRSSAGPGRDRVKVLDWSSGSLQTRVFADGLNIPSGIAVGYGGVWVAVAPDLLFLADDDGDGVADRREVVVTGFGRHDTHELPNSLTFGPGGWLYGLNGVFNPARIEQDGRVFAFTAGVFRVHPRTRRFEVFCEGTSNPWGIAFDDEGSLFVSACVIDHLWHLVEGGYYRRQSGASPAFMWELESIVDHRHQKAAYCGIHWLESDRFPQSANRRFYMGNIHGGCLNVDVAERRGASYHATPREDFLSTDDAWFMPVAQKTGPDGHLYVLDWYDRYHCYQDARRDPEGIDRARGRLYRVRWDQVPGGGIRDLSKAGTRQLLDLLDAPDDWRRRTARRLLAEQGPAVTADLEALVLDPGASVRARREALWARIGAGGLSPAFLVEALAQSDAVLRAWAVRAVGELDEVSPELARALSEAARDPDSRVALQLAIGAERWAGEERWSVWRELWRQHGEDPVLVRVLWNRLVPGLPGVAESWVRGLIEKDVEEWPHATELVTRTIDRLLAAGPEAAAAAGRLASWGLGVESLSGGVLQAVLTPVLDRTLAQGAEDRLRATMLPRLQVLLSGEAEEPRFAAARLAASWGDVNGRDVLRAGLLQASSRDRRMEAFEALIALGDEGLPAALAQLLREGEDDELLGEVIGALGRREGDWVATLLVGAFASLAPPLQGRVVEVLTQRGRWARRLLEAMGSGAVPRSALHAGHARRLWSQGDDELRAGLERNWGRLRDDRDPERIRWIAEVRRRLRAGAGDPKRGVAVFDKTCAGCHRLYQRGADVGPDLTDNGRNSLDQLLSNVLDPGLVVGADDRAWTLWTKDGRVLHGLLVEDAPHRVVLHVEGGRKEVVARDEVDELRASKLSLMPERLEEQIGEEALLDLFAYLILDRPPEQAGARPIPGARAVEEVETREPLEFNALVAEVAPGFETFASGDDGVALLPSFEGRAVVVRVHPVSRERPCVLSGHFRLGTGARLVIEAGHHPRGDWRLVVRVDGEELLDSVVGPDTVEAGWGRRELDLTAYADRSVKIEVENHATDWFFEYGYFASVRIEQNPELPR